MFDDLDALQQRVGLLERTVQKLQKRKYRAESGLIIIGRSARKLWAYQPESSLHASQTSEFSTHHTGFIDLLVTPSTIREVIGDGTRHSSKGLRNITIAGAVV